MKIDLDISKLSSENSNLKRRSLDEDDDDFFSDLMSIYVVPNDKWNQDTNGFEMQQVNLTWKATNFTDYHLNIDLIFGNESYISPNEV